MNTFRNRLAVRLSNWILNHVASREYCNMLRATISYGMRSALRDGRLSEYTPPPPLSGEHGFVDFPIPLSAKDAPR